MAIVFFHPKSICVKGWLKFAVRETVIEAERLVNSHEWLTYTPEIVCCPVD